MPSPTQASVNTTLSMLRQALSPLTDSPRLEAELLLCAVLEQDRGFLLREGQHLLSSADQQRLHELLQRRLQGEPLAYLLGRWGFWRLDLAVTPDVLVPRPDTETLVETALQHLPSSSRPRTLDLGTGSGAIALALALERPDALVWAVDKSPAALDLATRNGQALGLPVQWCLGDWFAALAHDMAFDLIVSNPPYVASGDPHLEALRFEPRQALVSGEDGLDDLRRIICRAPDFLKPGGWLCLEHGWDQGEQVQALLRGRGFEDISRVHDLNGQLRVSQGRWPGLP